MADDIRDLRSEHTGTGTLYVAATPLGNLQDASRRLLQVLSESDIVLAEDTRNTHKLMKLLGVPYKRLVSYHEHNETSRTPQVIEWLKQGLDVCLVSDAGTPLVSDPGYRVVRAARQEGLRVIPIPGPSAAVAGLSVSGLPTDKFLFLGFLPKRTGKRRSLLEGAKALGVTVVVYVPARSAKTLLEEISEVFGSVDVCLCREMTKLHEEYLFGTVLEVRKLLESRESLKGEVTLVIGSKEVGDG